MSRIVSEFCTSDLALAAFLSYHEQRHRSLRLVSPKQAEWSFVVNPDFSQLLDDYQQGLGEVEPKEFVHVLGRVRSELYQFMKDSRTAA